MAEKEYIKRDLTMQAIRNIRNTYSKAKNFVAVSAVDNILGEIADEVPAADVAPVVHGRWLNSYNDFSCAECGRCGTIFEVTDNELDEGLWNAFKLSYNYCPNCGAKMDEFLTELNGG